MPDPQARPANVRTASMTESGLMGFEKNADRSGSSIRVPSTRDAVRTISIGGQRTGIAAAIVIAIHALRHVNPASATVVSSAIFAMGV
jgi:hypothetical protein